MNDRDAIERFVRETLGCTCPDEVFRRVEHGLNSTISPSRPYSVRLAVGDRLLIYILDARGADIARLDLAAIVAAGRAERDALGFNRFRAVVLADDPDRETPALLAAFAALPGRDERVHLHVVADVPIPGLERWT